MDEATLRIENRQVDITRLGLKVSSLGSEFVSPDLPDWLRSVFVVPMAVPRGDDKGS